MPKRIKKAHLAVAVMVVAILAPATALANHVFSDVPDGAFYAGPVSWAFDNSITTGKTPTEFAPLDAVTRGESVTFLKRYDDNVVQPELDDRYTKSEIDAILAAGFREKFISLNVYADPALNFDERFANLNDAGVGGLNADLDFNFTVPSDHTPGTPLTVTLLAYARNAPCLGELASNFVFAMRANVGSVDDGSSSLTPAAVLNTFTADDVPQQFVFTLDSSTGFAAGDSISFGVSNLSFVPRCDLVVSGASVGYS